MASLGKLVVIRGELSGNEDLTIEGNVDGRIELKDHILTIGPNGRVKAEIFAKVVVVLGQVTGDIKASEKIDIRDNGSVEGDLTAPRVAIAEGAHFRGAVDMQKNVDLPRGAEPTAALGEAEPGGATISLPEAEAPPRNTNAWLAGEGSAHS